MTSIPHIAPEAQSIPCGVDWALWAASRGFPVFPVHPDTHAPYGNAAVAADLGIPEPPAGAGGCYLASIDPEAIRAMWAKRPTARVGLAMGQGRMALDVDEKDGKSGSATMAANGWAVPDTAMQRTPSGGLHYLVTVHDGAIAPTDKGTDGLGSGIDRRGDGGYIVLYDSEILTGTPAAAPEWSLSNPPAAREGGRKYKPGEGMRAQSYELALETLQHCDVSADRNEWLAASGAFVTATHGLAPDDQRLADWQAWCAGHGEKNNPTANVRQWSNFTRGGTDGDWRTLADLSGWGNARCMAWFGGELAAIPAASLPTVANDPASWLVHIDNLTASPPRFIVEGLVEQDALACIFGDPAAGKSLVAMDMAACVATGHPYHGHPVRKGAVIYIAGEGKHGLRRRFRAWEDLTGQSLAGAPLHISRSAAQFLDASSAAMVTAAIEAAARDAGPPKLIVVDTLARNFGAGDENSQKDMTAFVAALDRMRDRFPGCTVIVVHHSGHGEKDRARGSSVLRGAVDAEYKVERKNDAINLTCHKMKDAPPPRAKAFNLVQASGSVALEHTGEPGPTGEPSPNQRIALEAFRTTQVDGLVSRDDWRAGFYAAYSGDNEDTKRKAFKRAIDNLCENRFVVANDDGQTFRLVPMPGIPAAR